MVWRIAGLVILGMIGAGTTFAQPADDAAVCLDHPGPVGPQTAAFARLIEAGAGTPEDRAQYRVERGWAVDDAADAGADLNAAIALEFQNAGAFAPSFRTKCRANRRRGHVLSGHPRRSGSRPRVGGNPRQPQ